MNTRGFDLGSPAPLSHTHPQGPTQPWLISSCPSGMCSTHNLSITRTLQLQCPASALVWFSAPCSHGYDLQPLKTVAEPLQPLPDLSSWVKCFSCHVRQYSILHLHSETTVLLMTPVPKSHKTHHHGCQSSTANMLNSGIHWPSQRTDNKFSGWHNQHCFMSRLPLTITSFLWLTNLQLFSKWINKYILTAWFHYCIMWCTFKTLHNEKLNLFDSMWNSVLTHRWFSLDFGAKWSGPTQDFSAAGEQPEALVWGALCPRWMSLCLNCIMAPGSQNFSETNYVTVVYVPVSLWKVLGKIIISHRNILTENMEAITTTLVHSSII